MSITLDQAKTLAVSSIVPEPDLIRRTFVVREVLELPRAWLLELVLEDFAMGDESAELSDTPWVLVTKTHGALQLVYWQEVEQLFARYAK